MDVKGRKNRSWLMLEKLVEDLDKGLEIEKEVGFTYLNTILGRTYDQVEAAYKKV